MQDFIPEFEEFEKEFNKNKKMAWLKVGVIFLCLLVMLGFMFYAIIGLQNLVKSYFLG